MPRYVAFLRAINVGGHVVTMDRLRRLFEGMGLSGVRTFIASGNVIFESPVKDTAKLEKKIGDGLKKALGYDVAVFIRTPEEVAQIAEYEAFKSGPGNGSIFVCLLPATLGQAEQKTVAALQTPVDKLHAHKREIYWLATKNFRDAQFSPAKLEKTLGSKTTFRNVKTMQRLATICSAKEE